MLVLFLFLAVSSSAQGDPEAESLGLPGTTNPGARPSTRPQMTNSSTKPPVSKPAPKPSTSPVTPAKKSTAPAKKEGA